VSLLKEVENVFDQVRRRAFELFEQLGREPGKELDDRLNAESQFVFVPPSELREGKKNFEIHAVVPGFSSDELKVSVLPDCIIVSGKAESKKERKKGTVHFSEWSRKDLLRRFHLHKEFDPRSSSCLPAGWHRDDRRQKAGSGRP
jgi:HSP20 family molecular chaperone IbpA